MHTSTATSIIGFRYARRITRRRGFVIADLMFPRAFFISVISLQSGLKIGRFSAFPSENGCL